MLRFWVSALFLFVVLSRSADACSCAIRHPQTHFCSSDFVILATPKRKTDAGDGMNVFYSMKLDSIVKANRAAKEALKHGRVYTSGSSASCGVELQLDKQYLLTGVVVDNRADINSCGFIALWKDMPKAQKLAFQSLFKKSCGCTICPEGQGCTPSKTSCIYDISQDYGNCYPNYGVCLPKKGACKWSDREEFNSCLAN